jgi:hypothetical protein
MYIMQLTALEPRLLTFSSNLPQIFLLGPFITVEPRVKCQP